MTFKINIPSFFIRLVRLFIIPAFALFFTVSAQAKGGATTQLNHVLNLYYNVKDALTNDDAATASTQATEMLKAIGNLNKGSLTADEYTAFLPLQDKLKDDVKQIAETKDVEKQRQAFSGLSTNMYTLAKAVKISPTPVYEQYCPMKKAYWLSKEKAIKNPYYGSQMLTCGKVANTIE